MHSILFQKAASGWQEGLPLGNGTFGGMAFYRKDRLTLALNHYEVYYSVDNRYSHRRQEETPPVEFGKNRASYDKIIRDADSNYRDFTREQICPYVKTLWERPDTLHHIPHENGVSHPATAEYGVHLGEKLRGSKDFFLRLDLEDAVVHLDVKKNGQELQAQTRILTDRDAALTSFRQTGPGLVDEIILDYAQGRNQQDYTYAWEQVDEQNVLCRCSFYPWGEDRDKYPPFRFAVHYRLEGARASAEAADNRMILRLTESKPEFHLITAVVTELSEKENPAGGAAALAEEISRTIPDRLAAHQAYWKEFFSRSGIHLPDPVMERVWYLNLYALGCASGRNGRRKEQACGLNGLWDIRQPNVWGSAWYWDVNIESAFWPVYTANHLELAQAFNDGFLYYAEDARRKAAEFYALPGYAMDYPFTIYNCIWPWCAQFLWWYYEYSGDKAFLREKAYPLFYQLGLFIRSVMKHDEETDQWYFYPDLSPEQGPITRNTTVTVACVKYFAEFSLEACRILGIEGEERQLFRTILDRMPEAYPMGFQSEYGMTIKDSPDVPANLHLRHPSLLMPIYPIGEINRDSDPELVQIAKNTVASAAEHTEIGVFQFGWISAAAARLGMGNTARRLYYEMGLDHILRANGMGSEETERWIQHCVVELATIPSAYMPCMMECTGQMVSAVNEMLLQSYDGVIRVFPAIPNGDPESWNLAGKEEDRPLVWGKEPPADWKECSFDRLLAKGGFEVSARMKDGKICWVHIRSLRGGRVRLKLTDRFTEKTVRGGVQTEEKDGILSFDTEAGGVYEIGVRPEEQEQDAAGVLSYKNRLGHRVYVGKDQNTDAVKLLNSTIRDFYVDNSRTQQILANCFDFGIPLEQIQAANNPEAKKELPQDYLKQFSRKRTWEKIHPAFDGPSMPKDFMDVRCLKLTGQELWSRYAGFGFDHGDLWPEDGAVGDYMMRDCLMGRKDNGFTVELPQGIYNVLVLSGSHRTACHTILTLGNTCAELDTEPGELQAEVLPVVLKEPGTIHLELRTRPGSQWNLNMMAIRKVTALL